MKHLCGQTCLHKLVDEFMARTLAVRAQQGIADDGPVDTPLAATDASLTSNAAWQSPTSDGPTLKEIESSARLITPAAPVQPASELPRRPVLRPAPELVSTLPRLPAEQPVPTRGAAPLCLAQLARRSLGPRARTGTPRRRAPPRYQPPPPRGLITLSALKEDAVWMDLLLVLIVLYPLLCWSGLRLRRSPDPLPEIREQPAPMIVFDLQAEPEDRPRQSPAP